MDIQRTIQQGMALQLEGRLDEAATLYERVLVRAPGHFDALQLLGLVRFRSGDPEAGIVLLERALSQHPTHAATLNNLGNARRAAGDLAGAIDAYRRARTHSPQPGAVLLRNLGSALLEVEELPEAGAALNAALEIDPSDAVLWAWIGHYERACERYDRAEAAARRALDLEPTLVEAYRTLGSAAAAAQRWQDALRAYEQGLELDPGMIILRAHHYGIAQKIAHWDDWQARVDALVEAVRRSGQAVDPMRLLLALDDPALHRQCADRMALHHAERAAAWSRDVRTPEPPPRARVRVGYLSGDLRDHPVAQLLAGVLEHHDRDAFEIRTYALCATDGSVHRARIEAASERFVTWAGVADADLARRLAAEELDVLVDLAGHTEPGVPRVLAARPAPVQVAWLGYPGTLGTGLCDYLVADPVVVPVGTEAGYGESIARMPHCLLPNDRTRRVGVPRPRRDYGLPDDSVVMACFAQTQKITPAVFDAWMAAMTACPGTVLWLARPVDEALPNLAREARARGVDPARIVYATRTADPSEYLARYLVADFALDTFPYGSHSTAADIVWAGCPLIAIAGHAFQARVSASVLIAAGAGELIATDLEGYRRKIIDIAADAGERRRLRQVLASARETSALFDVKAFVEALEGLYSQMQARRVAGLAPTPIGH